MWLWDSTVVKVIGSGLPRFQNDIRINTITNGFWFWTELSKTRNQAVLHVSEWLIIIIIITTTIITLHIFVLRDISRYAWCSEM